MSCSKDQPKKTKGILKHRGSFQTSASAQPGANNDESQKTPLAAVALVEDIGNAGPRLSPGHRLCAPVDIQRRRTSFSDVAVIAAVPAAPVAANAAAADDTGADDVGQHFLLLSERLPSSDDPQHDADAEETGLTEEERRHRREFLIKRKLHCHQYQAAAHLLASGAATAELEDAEDQAASRLQPETTRRVVVVTEESDSDQG